MLRLNYYVILDSINRAFDWMVNHGSMKMSNVGFENRYRFKFESLIPGIKSHPIRIQLMLVVSNQCFDRKTFVMHRQLSTGRQNIVWQCQRESIGLKIR